MIGADADDLGVLQGNYHGTAVAPVTPLEGIRTQFGAANVRYAQGSSLADGAAVPVPETALRARGLKTEYFAAQAGVGAPSLTRADRHIDIDHNRAAPAPGLGARRSACAGPATFTPPAPGTYRAGRRRPRLLEGLHDARRGRGCGSTASRCSPARSRRAASRSR